MGDEHRSARSLPAFSVSLFEVSRMRADLDNLFRLIDVFRPVDEKGHHLREKRLSPVRDSSERFRQESGLESNASPSANEKVII